MMTEKFQPESMDTTDRLGIYLRHGHYENFGVFPSYEAICDAIAPEKGQLVIAVDGPSNGGKTSISDELTMHYCAKGIPVTQLPLDYFLSERPVRNTFNTQLAIGEVDIRDYGFIGWDHEQYHELLEKGKAVIQQNSGQPEALLIPNAYNRTTGERDHTELVTFVPGGIIVTEGTGIHALHDDLLDFKIRVDVRGVPTLLRRVVAREHKKPEDKRMKDEFVVFRYSTTDVPHTNNLRRASAGRADVVVDTTVGSAMQVYKNNPIVRRTQLRSF